MTVWLPGVVLVLMGGVGLRLWYRSWRQRRIASRRRVEAPNSHYSSLGVRNQEDRERWGAITLARLHPLNQDEVRRLLVSIDRDGIEVLSRKDRLFLDNMTLPRRG
jgi:hypothetical protein